MRPWKSMTMDFLFGLPVTKAGNEGVMVFVDRCSRMIRTNPVKKNITAEEAGDIFLNTIVRHYGVPEVIISDKDRLFISEAWNQLMKRLGTHLRPSTPFHPQTDGLTERANRSILQVLRCLCQDKGETWEEWLALVEIAYNSAKQSATQTSPHELVFGVPMRLPSNLWPRRKDQLWVEMLLEAAEHVKEAQQSQSRYANHIRREADIQSGDWVMVRWRGGKLEPRYEGPFRVLESRSNNVCKLKMPPKWRRSTVYHTSNLKKAPAPPDRQETERMEELYIMERVTGWKKEGDKDFWKIRWKGYGEEECTWESTESLAEAQAEDLIKDYKDAWNRAHPRNRWTGEAGER
eukprot:Blabericola_migrator_1__6736@NODE_3401_length_1806_cov_23_252444_g2117_i0_p1_GENE_NODE_3401_length_1806_cov_23_252444_g2117_i0NODE_3401_length_1806_cov_23_252444_g2117_i0_p1_ORF_typecomplete_len348_score32_19rve/PF00665_26/6_1e23Chromo/PF00385_24/7_7e03Chromo/PF00385_24/2_8e09MLVIN_C/PF18697_1/4_4e09MLVIN_C/PF18697_1/1_5e04DDE_2/PF02914_15/0_028_NODE_3401_length_1806_cov_23_252444_g2117_i01331176